MKNIPLKLAVYILLSCLISSIAKGEDVVAGERRVQAFKEALRTSNDPIEIAVKMARDKYVHCYAEGMQLLENSWEDPRSEDVLAEIAKGEPKELREGFLTQAGHAVLHLNIVRTNKEIKKLFSGKNTNEEKFAAIVEQFNKHPEWRDISALNSEKQTLVSRLIHLAASLGGAESAALVFNIGLGSMDEMAKYIAKYPDDSIQIAKKNGVERVLSTWGALQGLARLKRPDVADMIENWLVSATDNGTIETLIAELHHAPDGQKRLLKLLQDDREIAVYKSIGWLAYYFPNPETVNALKKLIETSKSDRILRQARGSIKRIEADTLKTQP